MKKIIAFTLMLVISMASFSIDSIERMGKKSGRTLKEDNSYINIANTTLKYSIPFEVRVAMGMEDGMSIIDKFGSNPDVDTATVPEYLWPLGGVYAWGNDLGETLYVSSSALEDTQRWKFSVLTLDSEDNWNLEVFEQNIAGEVQTALVPPSGDPVVRCFRMENVDVMGTTNIGTVYAYYDTTVINGIPSDQTKILAAVSVGSNQTKQLTFTIPSGYWGFLWRGEAGVVKSTSTNECDFAYESRRVGRNFVEKKDFGVMTSGANNYLDLRPFPDIIPAKTDLAIKATNVSANDMSAWGSFHILLITDERFQELQDL